MTENIYGDLRDELVDRRNGRWLGERGIFRHLQPSIAEAVTLAEQDGLGVVQHLMVTVVNGEFSGDVEGHLYRCVDRGGEVTYTADIYGALNNAVADAITATGIRMIGSIAKVANNLRYEWEIIAGVYEDQDVRWTVW